MTDLIKKVIRQLLPPIVMQLRSRLLVRTRGRVSPNQDELRLKTEFGRRNADLEKDQICFREDMTFRLHPDSRGAFECFCYGTPAMVEEMNCFLEHTKDRFRLLDIGALHGVFSVAFAAGQPEKTAVAVDASPIAFARLLYNVYKNELSNVTPVECAVSDSSGILNMHYEWEHAVAVHDGEPGHKYLCVKKETGDDLLQRHSFRPDVIKIDVEGHEVKVVKGLRAALTRDRPLIFLELHPLRIRQERDRVADMLEIFDSLGYKAASVGGGSIEWPGIAALVEDHRLILTPQ